MTLLRNHLHARHSHVHVPMYVYFHIRVPIYVLFMLILILYSCSYLFLVSMNVFHSLTAPLCQHHSYIFGSFRPNDAIQFRLHHL